MSHRLRIFLKRIGLGLIFLPIVSRAAAQTTPPLPDPWRYKQALEVPAAGLTRVDLPLATLDASRPALEDVRLFDPAGKEVPYLIERPAPKPETRQPAKAFHASLGEGVTTIELETGLTQPLSGVTLESPAREFIKSVRVEGSHDRQDWQELTAGAPVFRQSTGAEKLRVKIPPAVWEFLRLTVDDRRSEAVPFTGAHLHGQQTDAPEEPAAIAIKSREETPGVARIAVLAFFPTARLRL